MLALCVGLMAAAALAGKPAAATARDATTPAGAAVSNPPSAQTSAQRSVQADVQAARQEREAARRRRLEARRHRREMRKQLRQARRRLEIAAQQVAALSARLTAYTFKRWPFLASPGQGVIGVQLAVTGGAAGARVRAVSPGGAAEQAGVRAGDLIVALDGRNLRGPDPARRVVRLMRAVKPGQKVVLRVLRNGTPHVFTLIAKAGLGGPLFYGRLPRPPLPVRVPGFSVRVPRIRGYAASRWGGPAILRGPIAQMKLTRLTAQLGRYFGTDTGVLVVRAPPEGALGLKDGDVILAIGARKPRDSSQVIRILASYDPGQKVALQLMRMHHKIELTATMPSTA